MSVETPEMRDERSTDSPDVATVKAAGEGAKVAKNPFADLMLPTYSQEQWEAEVRGQPLQAPPAAGAGAQYARTGDTGAIVAGGRASGKAADLIKVAKKYIGTPYKWGGTSPLGFDCSGFVQYVYKQFGVSLPRVSYQQANYGKRISIGEARPGDLVAWDTSSRNNGADHIAIYLGDGLVIHAPKPGDRVKISRVWGSPWAVRMNM